MEYCYVWDGAPSYYLDLQKQEVRFIDPSFAAFLEPLPHRPNVGSLRYYATFNFRKTQNLLESY